MSLQPQELRAAPPAELPHNTTHASKVPEKNHVRFIPQKRGKNVRTHSSCLTRRSLALVSASSTARCCLSSLDRLLVGLGVESGLENLPGLGGCCAWR